MKLAATLLALLLPVSVQAQGARHAWFHQVPEGSLPRDFGLDSLPRRHDLTLALGGAIAGIGGFLGGAYLGAQLEMAGGCDDEWCGFGGAILGAATGATLAIPIGVHLVNDQRGHLGKSIAASGFALAAGIGASLLVDDARPLLLIPISQIIASVAIERSTSEPGMP